MTAAASSAARRIDWRPATVRQIVEETTAARTLVLDVPGWPGHRAGQHVDVRLTAEDGYQAQRSYSIASAPQDPALALTIERLEDGEVSSYLCGELREGDRFELRGPIGGYFVYDVDVTGPALLVAGGSGTCWHRNCSRTNRRCWNILARAAGISVATLIRSVCIRAKHAMFIQCPTILRRRNLRADQEESSDKRIGPALPG